MSSYPAHPRAVVTQFDPWAQKMVAAACTAALGSEQGFGYGAKPQHLRLKDVIDHTFGGWQNDWRRPGYAFEICEWEMGRLNRRPSSRSLAVYNDKEKVIKESADKGYRLLCHWLALMDAAVASGLQAHSAALSPDDPFAAYDAKAIAQLNQTPCSDGRWVSQGGKGFNKRPTELKPALLPLFDDELAVRIGAACEGQREKKIHDGRSVDDCLYFELDDVISQLLNQPYVSCVYALDRIRWLAGMRPRRPVWGSRDKPEQMRGLDDLAFKLACHWLALHEVLDGHVDSDDAAKLLFERSERLLLTDVEQLCDRAGLERQRDLHEQMRSYTPRGRLSALSA